MQDVNVLGTSRIFYTVMSVGVTKDRVLASVPYSLDWINEILNVVRQYILFPYDNIL